MKLVKFKDSTFGIRKFSWFKWEYFDFQNKYYWWSVEQAFKFYNDTHVSEEIAREALTKLTDKGEPI